MNRISMTTAGAVALCAGLAYADISYTQNGTTRVRYRTAITQAGAPTYDPGTTDVTQDLGSMFTDQVQDFSYTNDVDLSPYTNIDSLQTNYSVRTQAASDRFELTWSGMSQFQANTPFLSPDRLLTTFTVDAQLSLDFDSDTRIRISWMGDAGMIAPDLPSGSSNRVELIVSSANGSFSAFNAGIGDNGNTVSAPFSFEVDVLAGERIDLDMDMSFATQTRDGQTSELGWDQFQNSSFVIEVIPAPGTLALLGLGGVMGVRCRR